MQCGDDAVECDIEDCEERKERELAGFDPHEEASLHDEPEKVSQREILQSTLACNAKIKSGSVKRRIGRKPLQLALPKQLGMY